MSLLPRFLHRNDDRSHIPKELIIDHGKIEMEESMSQLFGDGDFDEFDSDEDDDSNETESRSGSSFSSSQCKQTNNNKRSSIGGGISGFFSVNNNNNKKEADKTADLNGGSDHSHQQKTKRSSGFLLRSPKGGKKDTIDGHKLMASPSSIRSFLSFGDRKRNGSTTTATTTDLEGSSSSSAHLMSSPIPRKNRLSLKLKGYSPTKVQEVVNEEENDDESSFDSDEEESSHYDDDEDSLEEEYKELAESFSHLRADNLLSDEEDDDDSRETDDNDDDDEEEKVPPKKGRCKRSSLFGVGGHLEVRGKNNDSPGKKKRQSTRKQEKMTEEMIYAYVCRELELLDA